MIALSAPIFDLNGAMRIHGHDASGLRDIRRRVNRTPTLDGGVAVNDRGYSAGDRTFRVRWSPRDKSEYTSAQRLVRLYSLLRVSTSSGVFMAAPESINLDGREATLTLLILEELT